MHGDQVLKVIAYPLSRFLFPALTFGRVRVVPWERRSEAPWAIRRSGRGWLEIGPDLAGLLACGLVAMEAFSLVNAVAMLQALPPL